MLNGLDLFSGIGGLTIALKDWVCPVAMCEIDSYCQAVLLSRMRSHDIPPIPIWDNIVTLDGMQFRGGTDIIYGGFPCQDISIAGNGKGLAGERSGLFFEILRLATEIKPPFIFLENVPAITSRGGLQVVEEIASLGYDCRWCVISAASIGAFHKRERWFLLAHSNSKRLERRENPGQKEVAQSRNHGQNVADTSSKSANGHESGKEKAHSMFGNSSENVSDTGCECERSEKKPEWPSLHFTGCPRIWDSEPEVGKLVDGVQLRMDRLRCLGNAVVPQQAKKAFEILMGINQT